MWAGAEGGPPAREAMEASLRGRIGPALWERFQQATVAVCGLGGLGSHIALALARARAMWEPSPPSPQTATVACWKRSHRAGPIRPRREASIASLAGGPPSAPAHKADHLQRVAVL